jgi:predicted nucleic acid-binding protein
MNGNRIDFVADTSAIILLCRRDPQVEEKVKGKIFAITFVTLAELFLGVLKSDKRQAAWSQTANVLVGNHIFHVSGRTPALYARIYFDLEQRGVKIPVNDIWIAAVAVESGLPLLARDEHFSRVSGLTVIQC